MKCLNYNLFPRELVYITLVEPSDWTAINGIYQSHNSRLPCYVAAGIYCYSYWKLTCILNNRIFNMLKSVRSI